MTDRLKRTEGHPADKISAVSDKNDLYVLKTCCGYLERHLARFSRIDPETFRILCWILGEDMSRLGDVLLQGLSGSLKAEIEEELADACQDAEYYADALAKGFRRCRPLTHGKLIRTATTLLERRASRFRYRGRSEIEENMVAVRRMFGLSDCEARFTVLIFILESFQEAESFFASHLEIHKYSGRKYLVNILGVSSGELHRMSSGTLKRIGLIEIDKWGISIESEFLELIQNPSDQSLLKKYYTRVRPGSVPLSQYFTVGRQTRHILDLLKTPAGSATHILLYGPPGTGKTSFARSLLDRIGGPAYEIVQGDKNTTTTRRAAISACLNMTGSAEGAAILVDEADNLLNTRASWFMRGETQDKGWLNGLLEKPGTRIIWITNELEGIDPSVLRRFAFSLQFRPLCRRQRVLLWENIVRKHRCKRFFDPKTLGQLAEKYESSAGVIDMAVRKAKEVGNRSKTGFLDRVEMALQSHEILQRHGEKPPKKDAPQNQFSLEGLNVSGDLESMLNRLVAFDTYLREEEHTATVNMNLLFYGPPGTGKSELARHLARVVGRRVICKRVSDLQSMYVGEGEKNIARAFAEAESEDAVLVIDEADSLLFARERAVRSWEISFTSEFLTRMESFRGILVCTTNRLQDVDHAALRRFTHKLVFKYLEPEGKIIFYDLFLTPLASGHLNPELKTRLKAIRNLAPGDFKVVRDRYCFPPEGGNSHKVLVAALEEEAAIKNDPGTNRTIGF